MMFEIRWETGRRACLAAAFLGMIGLGAAAGLAADFQGGFSRKDITPTEPLRLSGYGNRTTPYDGIETSLFVRAMALKADDGPVHVLLSVDTIGFSAEMTQQVFDGVKERHGLVRSRFVVCSSHSHTTPHLATGLANIFSTPLTEVERQRAATYTDFVRDQCQEAVDAAVADMKPVAIHTAQGNATFATNRRVLSNGKWVRFGKNPDGPVDHTLPVLLFKDPASDNIRGLLFNYACHGTTFGGDYNRVNAEWTGYAATELEKAYEGCVALPTIGCGADQNPERIPDRALELARAAGSEIAEEVVRLRNETLSPLLSAAPVSSFGYAGLQMDRPTVDELKERLKSNSPQVRRHAEGMLEVHARMGRLPESYPMPIQVWRFGEEFVMVFLGGEVCVDYAHRIKRELGAKVAGEGRSEPKVWVTAYANDVLGYVAPERMRDEGGYEVDASMIYYMQPGRWSSGTENVILQRVHELFDLKSGDEPLSLDDALKTFTVPEGYEIQVVAAEPLIGDPVNFAVDAKGRLWVVEMSDYPRGDRAGANGQLPEGRRRWNEGGQPWDGAPGGSIKILTDEDRDGRYDRMTVFAENLTFPTSVFPWRDGAIVTAAPDILFLRDTDGDGRADQTEVLYTGFIESNPQHRINGFEYGMDGWLYLASGAPSTTITCVKTGEQVNVSGRDLRIHPETGRLETVSGRSQYGRCRDDFGNAFGNTNSEPLFAFAIDDGDLQRNPFVASPSPRVFLTTPAGAPPVYPTSRTVDRFNDPSRANRFTSACGPIIFRDSALGPDIDGAAFLCEPVHNLVHRVVLDSHGVTFRGHRHSSEQTSEFLSSSDPWFRPVRLTTGPDRTLWVCDMYRHVIEHPQWIPEAWQARLDIYAGYDKGRIYRLARIGQHIAPCPDLTTLSSTELAELLSHENGWQRDTAQQLLIERAPTDDARIVARLRSLALEGPSSKSRVQALWTLIAIHPAARTDRDLRVRMFQQEDPRVIVQAIQVFGVDPIPNDDSPESATDDVVALARHADIRVRYQLALSAGDASTAVRRSILPVIARQDANDVWIRTAILSSSTDVAADLLGTVLREVPSSNGRSALVKGLIATSLGQDQNEGLVRILTAVLGDDPSTVEPWQSEMLAACLDAVGTGTTTLDRLAQSNQPETRTTLMKVRTVLTQARHTAADEAVDEALRVQAVQLLGRDASHRTSDIATLRELVAPQVPPNLQTAALQSLSHLGEVDFLIEKLNTLAPTRQTSVLTMLLSRPEWTLTLLQSLKTGAMSPSVIDASTRATLHAHRNTQIRELAAALFATPADGRNEVIREAAEALSLPADRDRGRAVFERRCASCHRHDNLGTEIGPQLSALQNKSREFLLTAILDPNRSVEAKYRSASVITTDGLQHAGMIVEETATSLVVARADGKKESILRRDIEELVVSSLSFMPEGLEKDLSIQDLADVMAFVADER